MATNFNIYQLKAPKYLLRYFFRKRDSISLYLVIENEAGIFAAVGDDLVLPKLSKFFSIDVGRRFLQNVELQLRARNDGRSRFRHRAQHPAFVPVLKEEINITDSCQKVQTTDRKLAHSRCDFIKDSMLYYPLMSTMITC